MSWAEPWRARYQLSRSNLRLMRPVLVSMAKYANTRYPESFRLAGVVGPKFKHCPDSFRE